MISWLFKKSHSALMTLLTALSFLMLFLNVGFIFYHTFVVFNAVEVLVGCVSLCVMIHLNKSLF